MRTKRRRALIWAISLSAVFLLIIVSISVAFEVAVRLVPRYRQRVEQEVAKASGYPLQIGSIDLGWRRLWPTLVLRDVSIPAAAADGQTGDAQPILQLGELRLGFSLWRLLQTDWLPVRAELRGLILRADVDEVGHWTIHGFNRVGGSDPGAALHELQRLHRLRLTESRLEVHDVALRGAPLLFQLRLADIAHSGDEFRFHADVEPPADIAGTAEMRGALDGDLGHIESLNGGWTLTIRDLHGWPWLTQELASDAALSLHDARLMFDGTLQAGQVTSIEVKASAAEVSAARDAHTLAQVSQFQFYARAQPTAQCWKVTLTDLELDGVRGHWRAGDGHYECTRDSSNGIDVNASIGRLRLDDLAPWLGLWKDLPKSAERVRDLRGDLQAVTLSTQAGAAGDQITPQRTAIRFDAQLQEGGLVADGSQIAVSGLTGHLTADTDSGQLQMDKTPLTVSLPQLFQSPLSVDALSAALSWHRDAQGWRVSAPQFAWAAVGTQGAGSFDLLLLPNAPPRLAINAHFSSPDATLLKSFIPLDWSAGTREWLNRALVKASVPNGTLLLEGAMQDFPFTESREGASPGRWALDLDVDDGTLAYSMDWPAVEHLHARLKMRGHGLSVDGDRAQIGGNDIDRIHASIPDFSNAQLQIDGSVHGEAARFYSVLRASPLHQKLSGLLDKTDISGAAQLDLHLGIPLADTQQTRASGHVVLNAVALQVHSLDQPIRSVAGALEFDGDGVRADALDGSFYAQPIHVNIHPEKGVPTGVLEAQTSVPLNAEQGLASAYLPDWLRQHLSGTTELQARLPLGGADEGRLTLTSDLRGVRSRLPPPLAKNEEDLLPLTAQLGSEAQGPLRLGLEVSDVLRLGLRFADQAGQTVVRGVEVRFDGGVIPRAEIDGIVVVGAPPRLDLAPWIPFIADLGAEGDPPNGSNAPGAIARTSQSRAQSLALVSIDLRPQKLRYGEFVLSQPVLHAKPEGSGYRVELSGEWTQGNIVWSKADHGHVVVRMERLEFDNAAPLSEATVTSENANDASAFEPAHAPTLDLNVDDLRIGEANLGHMSLTTSHVAEGQQLDSLSLRDGDVRLDANGVWRRHENQSSAELGAVLESTNIGAVFSAVGYPQTLDAKHSSIKASLAWLPDVAGLRWAQAAGSVTLSAQKGDLKSVEPGAGRALGLFSLYALPRHLLLDFRDVFAKGLSFDKLDGKFELGEGQARTDKLEIKSPSLRLVMRGRIGLADRDYDEHVTVYPDVTTGVTIAGGLAGGPIGAGIALVAQEALGKPFNTLSKFSYHVTGPWDNPQIKHGELNKDECPEETPTDVKSPTDAQGNACSPRVERPAKAEAAAPAAEVPADTSPSTAEETQASPTASEPEPAAASPLKSPAEPPPPSIVPQESSP